MSAFLLGLPGKIKLLLDRLTAVRAGYLDTLHGSLLSAPTTQFVLPTITRTAWTSIDYSILKENAGAGLVNSSANALTDVVSVTGQGVLNLAVFGGAVYTPGTHTFEVEIDGVVCSYATSLGSEPTVAVGSLDVTNRAAFLDQIPFRSSLVLRLRSNGTLSMICVYKYRITG